MSRRRVSWGRVATVPTGPGSRHPAFVSPTLPTEDGSYAGAPIAAGDKRSRECAARAGRSRGSDEKEPSCRRPVS